MNTKQAANKAAYTRHSPEYKQEALKLAAQMGVAKAAKQKMRQRTSLNNSSEVPRGHKYEYMKNHRVEYSVLAKF